MEFVVYFMFPCVGNMFGESGIEEIKEAMKNNGKLDILASLRLVMYSYLMYSCIKICTISYKFIYNQHVFGDFNVFISSFVNSDDEGSDEEEVDEGDDQGEEVSYLLL